MRTLPIEEERMLTQYFSELTSAQREAARNALCALPDAKEVSLVSLMDQWRKSVWIALIFWGSLWLFFGWQFAHVVLLAALGILYFTANVLLFALLQREPLHVLALHVWKDGPGFIKWDTVLVPLLFLTITGHTVMPFIVIIAWASIKNLQKKVGMRTSAALREIEARAVEEKNKIS